MLYWSHYKFSHFRIAHTALRRISCLLGEALASTTSLPANLEITGFSNIVSGVELCSMSKNKKATQIQY